MSEEREAAPRGHDSGDAVLASGDAVLASGDAVLASGDAALASGDAALASDPLMTAAPAASPPAPMLLPPNPVFRFYRGGAGIDAFRGLTPGSGAGAPEDWVGSTTTSFGHDTEGLAALADGRILRDVIAQDPVAFLGPEHAGRFGANPGLLVKLLDAGERLAVHFHPGRDFARRYLHSDFGKTEAWLILRAEPGAHMHLGLREDIDRARLERWVVEQDSARMLAALNEVPVQAGDALFVPAGTLHTIGSGITLIELQEPSDMSVVIEWQYAGVRGGEEHLGLGWDTILQAADTSAAAPIHIPGPAENGATQITRLLPPAADGFFRAELLSVREPTPLTLEPEFSILIGTAGELSIAAEHQTSALSLSRGQAALIPHAAGGTTLAGNGAAIRCLPPSPGDPGARA